MADFDRDGDLDIVIVSEDDFVVEYYLNDGAASFSSAGARIPVSGECNAVVAGDIDRDQDIDLILGCRGPERILINDGAGTFAPDAQRIANSNDITQDVALGDVDADGDLDLLAGNESGEANRLYLNDGTGRFSLGEGRIPLRGQREVTRNADFGDAEGDGDLDIFFANATYDSGHPQDRLLINDGTGRFTDETASRLPTITLSTFDGDFIDVDRDGDLDIVTANFPPGNNVQVYLNDGRGIFTERTSRILEPNGAGGMIEIEAADFNGDGKVDLLLAGFSAAMRLLFAR